MSPAKRYPFPATHQWLGTGPGASGRPVPFVALPNGDGTLLWGFTQTDLAESLHPTFVRADGQWMFCLEGEDISDEVTDLSQRPAQAGELPL